MTLAPTPFACRNPSALRGTPLRLLECARAAPDSADRFARAESAEPEVGVLDLIESLLGDLFFCEEFLGLLQSC
jgi:hypothetical protein